MQVNENLLQEITRRIAEGFHPERIVLFGSRARGDAREGSDVDLFVEMESTLPPPERAIAISRLFGLREWGLDLVVYTPAEVARLRPVGGTLLQTIEREGKLLYAAH
jgi:predicted nucleotidyltransferase